MVIEIELVEQRRLRLLPRSHHRDQSSKSPGKLNQRKTHNSRGVFQQYLRVPVGFFFEDMPGEIQTSEVSEIAPVNIDFMTSKEAVKLCQAFSRIEDQNVRTNLIQMTSAIAGEAEHAGVTVRV